MCPLRIGTEVDTKGMLICITVMLMHMDMGVVVMGGLHCLADMTSSSMGTQIAQCYHCFRVAAVIPTMPTVVPALVVFIVLWIVPDECCLLL
jgi:hypothetical protein